MSLILVINRLYLFDCFMGVTYSPNLINLNFLPKFIFLRKGVHTPFFAQIYRTFTNQSKSRIINPNFGSLIYSNNLSVRFLKFCDEPKSLVLPKIKTVVQKYKALQKVPEVPKSQKSQFYRVPRNPEKVEISSGPPKTGILGGGHPF